MSEETPIENEDNPKVNTQEFIQNDSATDDKTLRILSITGAILVLIMGIGALIIYMYRKLSRRYFNLSSVDSVQESVWINKSIFTFEI